MEISGRAIVGGRREDVVRAEKGDLLAIALPANHALIVEIDALRERQDREQNHGWYSRSVSHELGAVEVHVAQAAGSVALRLVVEMRRTRITALAARGDGLRPHAVAELHDGHEAVAARAVPFLGVGIGAGAERRQRAPHTRGERHRDAWASVVEMRRDVVVDTLEAIDLSPRRYPRPKIGAQRVHGVAERGE